MQDKVIAYEIVDIRNSKNISLGLFSNIDNAEDKFNVNGYNIAIIERVLDREVLKAKGVDKFGKY